jgi:hypothetical protein
MEAILSYLDWLVAGSKFHVVERKGSSITISRANESEECVAEFDRIVRDAISNSDVEGYQIHPHEYSMGPGDYEFAVIYFI